MLIIVETCGGAGGGEWVLILKWVLPFCFRFLAMAFGKCVFLESYVDISQRTNLGSHPVQ